MEIQQHDGMVVMEERGNPAGLRQAPRERRRRERGRAAPKERRSRVLGSPKPQLYIGGEGAAPPLGFPPQEEAASPRSHPRGRPRGGEGGRH